MLSQGKHRAFLYSVRTSLFVLTVLCISHGWVRWQVKLVRRQGIPAPSWRQVWRSVMLVLMGLLSSSVLSADDAINRIAGAWNKHYATFAQSDQYHYRCALTQRRKKAELTWNQVQLPESTQFVVEVFRLGPATRMDLASGGDFAAIDESGWIQIFDGRAGYVIQDVARKDVTIYSANRDVDEVLRATEPTADPLADVLGLSTSRAGPSFGLGIGPPSGDFDVSKALANGRFRIVSADDQEVELTDADGERFTLSVPHRYALVRREWIWDPETATRGSLVNRQWRQFPDGTWYPEISEFSCFESTEDGSADDLFTIQYRFEALPATVPSDFQIQADRAGMDISYHGRAGDFRWRRLKAGESFDLMQVAHDKLSIRWDAWDQPPVSIFEKANFVPLAILAVFLVVRWLFSAVRKRWRIMASDHGLAVAVAGCHLCCPGTWLDVALPRQHDPRPDTSLLFVDTQLAERSWTGVSIRRWRQLSREHRFPLGTHLRGHRNDSLCLLGAVSLSTPGVDKTSDTGIALWHCCRLELHPNRLGADRCRLQRTHFLRACRLRCVWDHEFAVRHRAVA